MAERTLRGRPASSGLALGPMVRLPRDTVALGRSGAELRGGEIVIRKDADPAEALSRLGREADEVDPAEEMRKLDRALEQAREELTALVASTGEMGADILEFQLALLEDPELVDEVRASIAVGTPVIWAWAPVLQRQVMAYEDAEDEYFRARAGDLKDVDLRVRRALGGTMAGPMPLLPGAVVVEDDLTPSTFLSLDWSVLGGVALERGSATSHVAMLARARGVPMAVGLGEVPEKGEALLDGEQGLLVVRPEPATRESYARRLDERRRQDAEASAQLARPAVTAAGERVEVMVNVDDPAAVPDDLLAAADGVGLFRTEFLFIGRDVLPTEEEQLAAYTGLLDRLAGKPCVLRTLDIGGDKPVPALGLAQEANAFLGLRGLRLCLERKDLFLPQIRAILRAAPGRALRVMLPMVTVAEELAEAEALFRATLAELAAEGLAAALPPLGIMVETPAAALAADLIPASFYSIGSNDLTQYVMAASREASGRVAALNDHRHPAVHRLIAEAVRHAHARAVPISLCGDMASDPALVGTLLGLGLRRLSVAPAALARVKAAVRAYNGPTSREASP